MFDPLAQDMQKMYELGMQPTEAAGSIMTPMQYIRICVFKVASQEEFAEMLGYSQAHISRMETGSYPISRGAQDAIRDLAQKRMIPWNNSWFFEVPPVPASAA